MKCQRCPKQATLHITEILADKDVEEVHLCEECAKKYLDGTAQSSKPSEKPVVAGTQVEPDDPGGKSCDACGIKFVEFRNTGRLGCPNDYDSFKEDLLPLLESIHGDVKHQGKTPRRGPQSPGAQNEIIQLRKRLQQAVANEAYEEAARIRDRLKQLEGG